MDFWGETGIVKIRAIKFLRIWKFHKTTKPSQECPFARETRDLWWTWKYQPCPTSQVRWEEAGVSGAELGLGVAGWPKPETQLGSDCLAFCRCFPFLSDRYLFPVWFCMDITGHTMNWRVEWGQAKVQIQTQLTFQALAFFFCKFLSPLPIAPFFLKGYTPFPISALPFINLFQQKIWHSFIYQSEFKPAHYLPLIFVAIELTFVCFWLCSYVYSSMKTASGAPCRLQCSTTWNKFW